MKRFMQSFAILGAILIMTSASAFAQGHVQERVTVAVPFAFSIGNHQLPAGTYTVQRVSVSGGVYFIKNDGTNEVRAISATAAIYSRDLFSAPRLVFRNYDGRYFLSQVWTSGATNGSELNKSRFERELSQVNEKAETIAIAAIQ